MKCPRCHSMTQKVLETRKQDSGIVMRRRACSECELRFTTHELPPAAFSYARADILKWEQRQIGEYKTKVAQRRKLAQKLRDMRKTMSVPEIQAALPEHNKLSAHMIYYYTSPQRAREWGLN